MNKKMTRFARGAKCPILADSGFAALLSFCNKLASAIEPRPQAVWRRNSRRCWCVLMLTIVLLLSCPS